MTELEPWLLVAQVRALVLQSLGVEPMERGSISRMRCNVRGQRHDNMTGVQHGHRHTERYSYSDGGLCVASAFSRPVCPRKVETTFAEMAPTDRHDAAVRLALWKTHLPTMTHEFIYKVLRKKLQVRQQVKLVKYIEDTCVWCRAEKTVYHFLKSCPMVWLLHVVCREVATPVVAGADVERWVSDDPIIARTNPRGLCVWWGLHRLWTLRCQTAVRGMDVGTLSVVMSLGVTFSEARAWFGNTERHEASQTAQRLSIWFC